MLAPQATFSLHWFQRSSFVFPMNDPPRWTHLPHWVDNTAHTGDFREYSDAEDPADTEPMWKLCLAFHISYVIDLVKRVLYFSWGLSAWRSVLIVHFFAWGVFREGANSLRGSPFGRSVI